MNNKSDKYTDSSKRDIKLLLVETEKDKELAKNIVENHHSYVPTYRSVGRRIDWLISVDDEIVGMIGIGSSTYPPCKDVLHYLGITKNEYKNIFNSIANNWRFCMAKNIPNIGTKILKLLRRESKVEWKNKYGDELKYYSGNNTYLVWRLLADSQGVKYWSGGNMVNDNVVSDVPNAQDQSVVRGQAIILKRANPENGFYIMGKPASAAVQVPLGLGYSLVAPPSVAAVDVNTGLTWNNIHAKDKLMVPSISGTSMTTLSWVDPKGGNNRKWCVFSQSTFKWEVSQLKIPAGAGAWFINGGTGSNKSFDFGTVAQ